MLMFGPLQKKKNTRQECNSRILLQKGYNIHTEPINHIAWTTEVCPVL